MARNNAAQSRKSTIAKTAKQASPTAATGTPSPRPSTTSAETKRDKILTLLRRKGGASLVELQTASGWQRHSVRGFLSGTVKKKLRLSLTSSSGKDGERRYVVKTN